ncbi:DUF484 family protein [methane-oxidizing endosymbiont of Gigantopelta aegis]|uniref:DUF484 family protein n=1 Tax=methane-oxidizing endosymbiont of Gigantopelta aegis TaxID=2794938 RepID=UPI0018DC2E25|nr:DUF484 family protein [methane-oxidizing endosymbiont of Gigantopelta aegis]
MTDIERLPDSGSALDSQQVADFLYEHPDFFHEHEDLLEHLYVPHPTGKAVSLISRQLEMFRKKHQELENQLATLIEIAHENDTVFSRMHELTLAMLESQSLDDVCVNLDHVLSECFNTDFVAIKIIRTHDVSEEPAHEAVFVAPEHPELKHFYSILSRNQPQCGHITLAQARFLFADQAEQVRSCAIIPMAFTQLEGLLAIGSRDENRFHASMGHLFLTQMSEIIGTRLIAMLTEE